MVVQPVAIKYLCVDPIDTWAERQLDEFERRLGWYPMPPRDIRTRTVQVAEALLGLKEVQYSAYFRRMSRAFSMESMSVSQKTPRPVE